MKILAIESSSLVASVAILTDDVIKAEYTINHKITHSQTLLPMIDEICKRTDTDVKTLDAIAVSGGPGSFTGLRIGSATAKGLGLALNIPLVHVPTLDAMAYNAVGSSMLVCPIMDARRNQVYTAAYIFNGTSMENAFEQCAIPVDELLLKLKKYNRKVLFIGDGIPPYRQMISDKAEFQYEFAPANINRQRATSVAALGAVLFKQGKTVHAREHLPEYLRLSQAEREMMDKNGK